MLLATAAGSVAGMAGHLGLINWYAHQPCAWVVDSAAAGHPKALAELRRRVQDQLLSVADTRRLTGRALDIQQQRSPERPQAWIDLLDDLAIRGQLDDSELQRFYDQMLAITLEAPPYVYGDDEVPIRFRVTVQSPTNSGHRFQATVASQPTLNGQALTPATVAVGWGTQKLERSALAGTTVYASDPGGVDRSSTSGFGLAGADLPLGRHLIGLRIVKTIAHSASQQDWEQAVDLEVAIEKLPPDPHQQALTATLQRIVHIDHIYVKRINPRSGQLVIGLRLDSPLPCGVQARVVPVVNGVEYGASPTGGHAPVSSSGSWVSASKGSLTLPEVTVEAMVGSEVQSVYVMLRSTATVDHGQPLPDRWYGTVMLGPATVSSDVFWRPQKVHGAMEGGN